MGHFERWGSVSCFEIALMKAGFRHGAEPQVRMPGQEIAAADRSEQGWIIEADHFQSAFNIRPLADFAGGRDGDGGRSGWVELNGAGFAQDRMALFGHE